MNSIIPTMENTRGTRGGFVKPAPSLQWHSYCKPTISSTLQTNFFPSKLHEGMEKTCKLKILLAKNGCITVIWPKKIPVLSIYLLFVRRITCSRLCSLRSLCTFPLQRKKWGGKKARKWEFKSWWFPPGSCFECCSRGLPRQCKAVSLLIAFH